MHRYQISILLALTGLLAFTGCKKQPPTPAPQTTPAVPAAVAATSPSITFLVKRSQIVGFRKANSQILANKGDTLKWKVIQGDKPIWIHFKDKTTYCIDPDDPSQTNDFKGEPAPGHPATCMVNVDDATLTPHEYQIYDEPPSTPPAPSNGNGKDKVLSQPRSCGGCVIYGGG